MHLNELENSSQVFKWKLCLHLIWLLYNAWNDKLFILNESGKKKATGIIEFS